MSLIFRSWSSVNLFTFDSFHRLLENEKLLLVLVDQDRYLIYLKDLSTIDATIQRGAAIKALHRGRVGENALFAYDEAKRVLTVYASAKVSSNLLAKVVLTCRISC